VDGWLTAGDGPPREDAMETEREDEQQQHEAMDEAEEQPAGLAYG
jgi:hypothetical protein